MRARLTPLLVIAAFAACVSIEPGPVKNVVIRPGQRTVLLVYPSPGPWVSQSDTKADSAAKFVPGIGLMWQGAQDERALKDSNDLKRYLPGWHVGEEFFPHLASQLKKTGYPGKWLDDKEAGLSPEVVARFNRAKDVLKWRSRFFVPEPRSLLHLRNYSNIIQLDDALVLEVNIQYGVTGLGAQVHPVLESVTRLFRAGTMRLLWEHKAKSEDAALTKHIYDFKVDPEVLKKALRGLMPDLATQIAAGLRKDIVEKSLIIQRRLDALSPAARGVKTGE